MSRAAALLVLVSASCAPLMDGVAASPALRFGACPSDLDVDGALTAQGAECATLTVPLDWSSPDGAELALRVARWPATDAAARIGVLTFDYGGPGIPAIARTAFRLGYAGLAGENEDVARRFDRVALDRRGTRLGCIDAELARRLTASPQAPDDEGEWHAALSVEREIAEACAGHEVVRFVDVESAARDLDALRDALGEDVLHMVASSQGTRAAATYLTLFPERVGRFVLDSPALVVDDAERHVRDQAAGYDAAAARFFEWCAVPANSCRFAAASAGEIASAFDTLVAFLDALPVDAENEDGELVTVDGGFVLGLLTDATFAPDKLWPAFGLALSRADAGDLDNVATLAARLESDLDEAAFRAIVSTDRAWPGVDRDALIALSDELAATTRTGRRTVKTEAGNAVWTEARGLSAPVPSPIASTSAPPALILTARFDGATPHAWAGELRDVLANDSVLLVLEGDGHTRAPDIACLGRAAVDFLVDGTLPAAPGEAASCAAALGE